MEGAVEVENEIPSVLWDRRATEIAEGQRGPVVDEAVDGTHMAPASRP
jgi:hypothetical protein